MSDHPLLRNCGSLPEDVPVLHQRERSTSWQVPSEASAPVKPKPSQSRALLLREARAVSLWAILCPLLRVLIHQFTEWASFQPSDWSTTTSLQTCLMEWCMFLTVSMVARGLVYLGPWKLFDNQAPGFVYGSTWLLLGVDKVCGSIPHLPTRICECILGRLTWLELGIVVVVHFVCSVSTSVLVALCLPEQWVPVALTPMDYDSSNSAWHDAGREALVQAGLAVGLLVLPTLFRLNQWPQWTILLVLYPLYSVEVDARGMASACSPNMVFTLSLLSFQILNDGASLWLRRVAGPLVGGVLAGKIMSVYFPDDPKV